MKTDLKAVKDAAIQLIYVEPQKAEDFNICKHPYIDSPVLRHPDTDKPFNLFQDTEKYHYWQEVLKEDILHRKNVYSIISLVRVAHRMDFFKDINKHLSDKDFAEILQVCWTSYSEAEVEKADLEVWFQKADKKYLMSKREQEVFNRLPKQVVIYRGCSPEYKYGLSWTLDKQVALWYADKYDNGNACVYECTVNKQDIFCYFDIRNEEEVLIKFGKNYYL